MNTGSARSPGWDDLRIVLTVLRHGSLSAAARALGSTQPTVSRRLDAVERQLGFRLFDRAASSAPTPTPLCRALLEGLDGMEQGALAIQRRIAARDTGLQGSLRVTSLDWLGDSVVAPMLARFAALHASLDVELVNEGRVFNLARGEADVALRFGPFAHENIVERKVADVRFGLYASAAYLAARGRPDFAAGCAGHAIATLHREGGTAPDIGWLRSLTPAARVLLRANGVAAQLAAAEAGVAIVALPHVLAVQRPALRHIAAPMPEPVRAVRLGVHADLRKLPRIRAFINFAVADFASRAAELNPAPKAVERP